LFALGLAGFMGLVGMSVDVGRVVYTRTELQKEADAAALAGAQDLAQLSPDTGAAQASADSYVTKGGGTPCAGCVTFSSTTSANDTITVVTRRHVDYSFLKVIGMTGADPSATAKARVSVVTGLTFDDADILPYTVWGGQRTTPNNGCPYQICMGSTQTYRANNFQSASNATGTDWAVNGNNFKGYFHHGTGVTQLDSNTWQTFSSGGNAIGQEPTAMLDAHIASGEPIIVPVVEQATCTGGCGTIQFKIVAWVALRITSRGNASSAWTGTVVNWSIPAGTSTGGTPPPASFPSVRTISLAE
jgi:Flp pilus assembly protein TadG